MKTGKPVGKIARRLGVTPTKKTIKIVSRRPNPPGQHGSRRRGSHSIYREQLIEKQKLRFQFMISEKILTRAYANAKKQTGSTGENLIKRLDTRLDATIFRAGIVASIPAARQLVSHRHVLVNGKRVSRPSFSVQLGDVISFSEKAQEFAILREGFDEALHVAYLEVDKNVRSIRRTMDPERSDIPVECNEQLVVELFSR